MLCLVTDRRRIGGSLDGVVDQARAAVASGIDLFQIRERDLEAADLGALVDRVVRVARGSETRVIVNDRLDVALGSGADGVHLRADSIAPSAARRLAPARFLIGRSVHTVADVRSAGGADYLIAGTVFPSRSKADAHVLLGLAGLRAIVESTRVPVVGIGGITLENLAAAVATGAAGAAAIGMFATCDVAEMRRRVSAARLCPADRARFDSLKTSP